MSEEVQMHEQTIDHLIKNKMWDKCPGDALAWRGLHVEMGSFTDLADWLDAFVDSGACGYAYQGDAFSDSTNSMATWVSCLADKIRRMASSQNADTLRERRREVTDTNEAITGNAAKMREVVELLARVILPPQEEYPAEYGGGKVPDEDGWLAWIRQVQSYAKSALAEPPRNCDLFNSGDAVKDAQAAWDALGPKVAMELDFLIAFTWLFRKAKRMCGVRYESEVAK